MQHLPKMQQTTGDFHFDEPATEIQRTSDGWLVNGKYSAKAIINAAGVYADQIHNLVSDEQMTIRPRRGQYFLLDKAAGNKTKMTLFQLPTIAGKGVLVAPTCHGNLIVGPTAEFVEDKEELNTTAQGLSEVRSKAVLTIPDLPFNQVITSFLDCVQFQNMKILSLKKAYLVLLTWLALNLRVLQVLRPLVLWSLIWFAIFSTLKTGQTLTPIEKVLLM